MLDIAIVVAYLVVNLWIGLQKKLRASTMRSFAIGDSPCSASILQISLLATFIGGTSTIGLAESTFSQGLIFTLAMAGMSLSRILEAKIVVPKIAKYFGFLTVSEIMGSIYGKNIRIFTAFKAIISAIFVVAVQLKALGVVFKSIFNISPLIGILIGAIVVIMYASLGGIKSITYTDIFQFAILIIAIPLIAFFSIASIGGFEQLISIPLNTSDTSNQVFKNIFSTFVVCAFPALFPEMVQRYLMTQDTKRIKSALYVNAAANLPIYLLVGIIGVIAANNFPSIEANLAFPVMVKEVLPIGIKGIVISGLLAIMMSSADSFLNTVPIAITHDILKPIFPNLPERYELSIAQITTVISGMVAIVIAVWADSIFNLLIFSIRLWIPIISPGLILGILGLRPSIIAFWSGIALALLSWALSSYLGLDSSLGSCLGALLNVGALCSFVLLKQDSKFFVKEEIGRLLRKIKKFRINIRADYHYETISGFIIIYPISTVFTLSFNGYHPQGIYYICWVLSALLSLILIFRDSLSSRYKFLIYYSWNTALFLIIFPSVNLLLMSKFSLGLLLGLIISFLFLCFLTTSTKSVVMLMSSFAVAYIFNIPSSHISDIPIIATFEDAILKCFMVIFCIIMIRNKENQDIDALNGFVSHEINHSISSFHINENLLGRFIEPLVCSYELARQNSISVPEISSRHLEALRKIPHQVKQNTNRIRNNLDLLSSKITSEPPIPCSAKECIKAAMDCFDPTLELDKIMAFDQSEDFIFIGQEKVFINVFHNLIHNALHEINKAKRGNIIISIKSSTRTVTITDTAKGISKENLSKLFSPGFTNKAEGMGIGLNFCRNALEHIGGTIKCDSVENQYAKFILTFPSRYEAIV